MTVPGLTVRAVPPFPPRGKGQDGAAPPAGDVHGNRPAARTAHDHGRPAPVELRLGGGNRNGEVVVVQRRVDDRMAVRLEKRRLHPAGNRSPTVQEKNDHVVRIRNSEDGIAASRRDMLSEAYCHKLWSSIMRRVLFACLVLAGVLTVVVAADSPGEEAVRNAIKVLKEKRSRTWKSGWRRLARANRKPRRQTPRSRWRKVGS